MHHGRRDAPQGLTPESFDQAKNVRIAKTRVIGNQQIRALVWQVAPALDDRPEGKAHNRRNKPGPPLNQNWIWTPRVRLLAAILSEPLQALPR